MEFYKTYSKVIEFNLNDVTPVKIINKTINIKSLERIHINDQKLIELNNSYSHSEVFNHVITIILLIIIISILSVKLFKYCKGKYDRTFNPENTCENQIFSSSGGGII